MFCASTETHLYIRTHATRFFPALKFSVDAAAPLYSQEITVLRLKVKEPRSEEECKSIFQVDISQKQQQEKKELLRG